MHIFRSSYRTRCAHAVLVYITVFALLTAGVSIGWFLSDGLRSAAPAPVPVLAVFQDTTGSALPVVFLGSAALFSYGQWQSVVLPQSVSASGARYANRDESVVLWNKGDTITLTVDGKRVFTGTVRAQASPAQGKLPAGSSAPGTPDAIKGVTWVWTGVRDVEGVVTTPRKAGAFSWTLDENDRVSGTTDCNSWFGQVQIGSDGVISFGSIGSTKMFCMGDTQEDEFLSLLDTVRGYALADDTHMSLTLRDGQVMLFEAKQ